MPLLAGRVEECMIFAVQYELCCHHPKEWVSPKRRSEVFTDSDLAAEQRVSRERTAAAAGSPRGMESESQATTMGWLPQRVAV